jgi:hypothetical protein
MATQRGTRHGRRSPMRQILHSSSGKTLSASKQGAKSSNDRRENDGREGRERGQRRSGFKPCAAAAR